MIGTPGVLTLKSAMMVLPLSLGLLLMNCILKGSSVEQLAADTHNVFIR